MKNILKKSIAALIVIVMIAAAIPASLITVFADDQLADGYELYAEFYYDADNPGNYVYNNSKYKYECYVKITGTPNGYKVIFVYNGKIVRNSEINSDLMKMYFAQAALKNGEIYDEHILDILYLAEAWIDWYNAYCIGSVIDKMVSITAKSAGVILSIYATGGTTTAAGIASIVGEQVLDDLTSHISDVSVIISDAQMTLTHLYVAKIKSLKKEIESKNIDMKSFSSCEKYFDSVVELNDLCDGVKVLTTEIMKKITESNPNIVNSVLDILCDVGEGMIGPIADLMDTADDVNNLLKSGPTYIASLIEFATALNDAADSIEGICDVITSASDIIKEGIYIFEAYEVSHDRNLEDSLITFNKIALAQHPDNSTEPEATEPEETEPEEKPSTSSKIPSENDFLSIISMLKEKYPHGKYWNKYNGTEKIGKEYVAKAGNKICSSTSKYNQKLCTTNGTCAFKGKWCNCKCGYYFGYQCFGFANLMAYYVFGSYASTRMSAAGVNYNKGWTYKESVSEYYAGDIVRTGDNAHSIFITKVTDTRVYYVDCNASGPCKIRWDAYMSISTLKSKTDYVFRMKGNTLKGNGEDATPTLNVTYNANGGTIPSSETVATEYKVTATDGLNVRASASTSGTKLGAIAKGTSINVTETKNSGGYTWGKITYQKQDAWVALGVISGESYTEKVSTTESSDYYIDSSIVYKTSTSKPHTSKFVYGKEYKDGYANGITRFGLEREGYVFMGWSLSPNGANYLPDNVGFRPEEIVPEVANGSKSITVYAVWEPVLPEVTDDTVKNIYITSIPQKNYYTVGDSIPKEDIEIVVEHTDGRLVRKTDGFTCIPSTLSFEGTQEVEVYYEGASAKFTVQVTDEKSRANNATADSDAKGYMLPSTSAATLKDQGVWKGDKLQVLCRDGDFYLCLMPWGGTTTNKTNGTLLYFKTSVITVSGSVPSAEEYYSMSNGTNNAVITADTKLFFKPDGGANSITCDGKVINPKSISKDTEIKVLFELDGYYCVQTSKYTGFVSKSVVKFNTITCGVSANIEKDEFYVDGIIDASDIAVNVTMSDGSVQSVTNAEITIPDTSVAGDKYITVQAGEFYTFIPVTVKEMEIFNMTVSKMPDKLVYVSGEEFDKSGMSVSLTYSDGSVVDVTDDVVVEYNFEEAGYTSVAISYGDAVKYIPVLVYDRPDFEVYDVTGSRGDRISVPISYYSYTDVITPNSVKFILLYDAQILEYMDSFATSLEDTSGLSVVEVEAGHLEISYEGNESLPASCIIVSPEFELISYIDNVSQIYPCNIELCDSMGNSFELNTYFGNVYNVKTYTLTLYNHDGSVFGNGEATYDEGLSISDAVPEREGYIFVGWSEEQNAESATYFVNDVVILERDIDLYPVWEKLDDGSSEEETDEPTEENPSEDITDESTEENPSEDITDEPTEENPSENVTDESTEVTDENTEDSSEQSTEKNTEDSVEQDTEGATSVDSTEDVTTESKTESPTSTVPDDGSTEGETAEDNKNSPTYITIGCNSSLYSSVAVIIVCTISIILVMISKKKKRNHV